MNVCFDLGIRLSGELLYNVYGEENFRVAPAHIPILGSLSTDICEPRTATGSQMFPFLAWFCSLPQTGKALVDDCGLTLQMQWPENAPKREKFKFQLPSVAQKHLCLSSLLFFLYHINSQVST